MYQPDKIEHLLQPDVKPVDETGQLLLNAALLLRVDGWCQHSLVGSDGRMCMHGAIGRAAPDKRGMSYDQSPAEAAATLRVAKFLGAQPGVNASTGLESFGGQSQGSFDLWNDVAGRTAEEVIAVLEGAARAT